jgi:MtaA/CmuA family methyltransferase
MSKPVPFHPILMHFAARHAGYTYGQFASDYRALVESNLRCRDDFGMDAVGVISDPFRETSAFGARIEFPDEAVPRCKEILVRSMEDIDRLKNPDVYREERTKDRIRGAEALRKMVGPDVPVIGWIEGPLAEICDLAGVNEVLLRIYMEPDFLKRLIDKVMPTAKDFARAQVEAGCDIMGVGDAICSQVDPETYRQFVKEKHKELFEYIHSLGARVKLHICGNITHLLEDLRETGADIVDIDWMVDMDLAYEKLGSGIIRCGNLDPVTVIQDLDTEKIRETSEHLCEKEEGRPFIFSGGCEITVNTPDDHLLAMRRASREIHEH